MRCGWARPAAVSAYRVTGTLESGFYGAPNTWVDGSITFSAPVTGALKIKGKRAPRRQDQFQEGRGVPARDHNVAYNELTAVDQELRRDVDVLGDVDAKLATATILINQATQLATPGNGTVNDPKVAVAATPSSAIDPAKIRFLSDGAGAVTQFLDVALKANALNARWFGAKGDGAADDTAALNLALAAQCVTGKALYIPAGTYLVSTLTYPGHPTNFYFYQGVIFGDYGKTIIRQKATSAAADIWQFNTTAVNRVGDLQIRNLTLNCEVNKTGGRAMYFYGCARIHLDGILMRGDSRVYDGIEFNGCASMIMKRCIVFQPARDGIIAYSDGTTGGAGLFIDETNVILTPGRDGLSIRGGMGGVHCELHVYEAQRYACAVMRIPADGGNDIRNRDLHFGPNCSFDNPKNGSIYFGRRSVEMAKVQGGWHNAPLPPTTGAAFMIKWQGSGESSGYLGMMASFHFDNVTSRQGNGPAVVMEDACELKIDGCDFSRRSAGAAIFFGAQDSGGSLLNGSGFIEITNTKIIGGTGAGIQAATIPERVCITGNLVYGNAGGNFVSIPTSPGGSWVGVIANNVTS